MAEDADEIAVAEAAATEAAMAPDFFMIIKIEVISAMNSKNKMELNRKEGVKFFAEWSRKLRKGIYGGGAERVFIGKRAASVNLFVRINTRQPLDLFPP